MEEVNNDNKNKHSIDDVFEIVEFIKDNAVTKTEFNERMSGVENRMDKIEGQMTNIEGRMTNIEGRMTKTESLIVTKEYLDEKMADFRGDLILIMRGEDKKVLAPADLLKQKNILTDSEYRQILAMKPFPQTI